VATDDRRRNNTRFLAAYHFSDLKTGKYLAQFIPAEVSFINYIPFDILGTTLSRQHGPNALALSVYSFEVRMLTFVQLVQRFQLDTPLNPRPDIQWSYSADPTQHS